MEKSEQDKFIDNSDYLVITLKFMKYFLFILLVISASCHAQIKYPDGGYDYPKNVTGRDTLFYRYPVKKDMTEGEAYGIYYEYLFFQPFNEPNLSINPQPKETFRLTFSTAFGESFIITFNDEELVIKKGNPSTVYITDTNSLTKKEKLHFSLLERYPFPFDTTKLKGRRKKYLDSLINIYPEMLDINYYHKLFDKSLVVNNKAFEFETEKIQLEAKQFKKVVEQINSLGYWALPYRIKCDEPVTDGYGYTLEANTLKKYKIVGASACSSDTTTFPKICQKIIELAQMDKEVNFDVKWEAIPVE